MARQKAAIEVNRFVNGLNTDSSPLTSPDGFSIDEENMVLNIDGSRNRRLGLDFETGYSEIDTTIASGDIEETAVSTFKWTNAAGNPEQSILVVQFGNELKFFNLNSEPLSSGFIYRYRFHAADRGLVFSYAVVDGILIVTPGTKSVYVCEFDGDATITVSPRRLYVRDFWGVEDNDGTTDLTQGSYLQNRPTGVSSTHLYNLRNQGWGIPRVEGNTETLRDPIANFRNYSGDRTPSNADTVIQALYPDPEDTDNRTIERFFATDVVKNPIGSTRAAQGYYIIDVLDRGNSRFTQNTLNDSRYNELIYRISGLLDDETPTGATAVAEYAGRVWYGGFPGDVIQADKHSPKLSSYVLFSKVVDSVADINLCYQEGDPTSKENPEIIDTDGGFIRINGAFGIVSIINVGSSLMVIAKNGVWRITGGSDNGFTATSYIVEKISRNGCYNPGSVVVVDNTIMFWGDDGIYHIKTDEFGSWVVPSISTNRVQTLFDSIPVEKKRKVMGAYDNFDRKVRWIYNNTLGENEDTRELVFDTTLQAYYLNRINRMDGDIFPKPVALYVGEPYLVNMVPDDVYVGTELVEVVTETVQVNIAVTSSSANRELGFVVVTEVDPVIEYSFATYRDAGWRDWRSIDGVGVDAADYTVTNYISGGDFLRNKQVPTLVVYMRKTESGFVLDADEDFEAVNPSSVITQVMWQWTNSGNSGKWGRPFQAYRHRRHWTPTAITDEFDDGNLIVFTRNRLRGNGRVLSMKFSTEPDKDFHLYGWSMVLDVEENG